MTKWKVRWRNVDWPILNLPHCIARITEFLKSYKKMGAAGADESAADFDVNADEAFHLEDHMQPDDGQTKYMSILQRVANRTETSIYVDLKDLYEVRTRLTCRPYTEIHQV